MPFLTELVATDPPDSEPEFRGAARIRELKSGISGFAKVVTNPETGEFRPGSILRANLAKIHLAAREWSNLKVGKSGLVEDGQLVVPKPPGLYKGYTYTTSSGGFQRSTDTQEEVLSQAFTAVNDRAGIGVSKYTFTVPKGVSRMFVFLHGAGGGGGAALGGGSGGYLRSTVEVTAGEAWTVWVGQGGGGGDGGILAGETRVFYSNSRSIGCYGGANGFIGGAPGALFYGDYVAELHPGRPGVAGVGGLGRYGLLGAGGNAGVSGQHGGVSILVITDDP